MSHNDDGEKQAKIVLLPLSEPETKIEILFRDILMILFLYIKMVGCTYVIRVAVATHAFGNSWLK